VRKNLEYGLKRIESAKQKVDMESICALLGINHLLERSTARLSGGEKQRISIARALLTSPDLLLMDEPLSALDNRRKAEILPYLEKLHKELSIPVIYVTHSVEELARLADHIVLFDKGTIVASDNAISIMSDPQYQELFGDGLGSIIDTTIAEHCDDHMTRLDIGGNTDFWIRSHYGVVGEQYRCRILASDVSVCLSRPKDSSISNEVLTKIVQIEPAAKTGEVTLVLETKSGNRFLSLITERSLRQLGLSTGIEVWAQVKSVAIC
jgi:molybdate transport system ATP-binding protein